MRIQKYITRYIHGALPPSGVLNLEIHFSENKKIGWKGKKEMVLGEFIFKTNL